MLKTLFAVIGRPFKWHILKHAFPLILVIFHRYVKIYISTNKETDKRRRLRELGTHTTQHLHWWLHLCPVNFT